MIPPLAALQAFETIARRKSFALAAEELHLTPSAVSHQVAKLEGLLNVRLFERSARGVELTPAGQQYLQRVASALGAINAATKICATACKTPCMCTAAPVLPACG